MEQLSTQKFSISYDQPLMDIAGNVLDVKMVQHTYAPDFDAYIAKICDKKEPKYFPAPESDKEPICFKFDNQGDMEACLPKHTPKMRELRPEPIIQHTEQQPSPLILHRSPTEDVLPVLKTL